MVVESKDVGLRIDKYLSGKLELSRSKVQRLVDKDLVLVNGKPVNNNYKVRENDDISVNIVEEKKEIKPQDIKLDIVYEDDYLMIINKESGMVVHPAAGHFSDTLVNALAFYLHIDDLYNIRPGIVHRLDKDTSGLMVVAKDDSTLELLSKMIKEKKVKRHYLALVQGRIMHSSGKIDAPIGRDPHNRQRQAIVDGAKSSVTNFKVLKRFKNATLEECELETGRTHQIRVHMKYIGHPIVNDPVYSNKKASDFGQMLHSKSIEFIHPITGKHIYFEIDPPREFLDMIKNYEEE